MVPLSGGVARGARSLTFIEAAQSGALAASPAAGTSTSATATTPSAEPTPATLFMTSSDARKVGTRAPRALPCARAAARSSAASACCSAPSRTSNVRRRRGWTALSPATRTTHSAMTSAPTSRALPVSRRARCDVRSLTRRFTRSFATYARARAGRPQVRKWVRVGACQHLQSSRALRAAAVAVAWT